MRATKRHREMVSGKQREPVHREMVSRWGRVEERSERRRVVKDGVEGRSEFVS